MNTDGASTGLLEAGDQAQAGGLARAGRAEHGEEFAILDVDGHPIDGFDVAERAGHIGELHCKGHVGQLQDESHPPPAPRVGFADTRRESRWWMYNGET